MKCSLRSPGFFAQTLIDYEHSDLRSGFAVIKHQADDALEHIGKHTVRMHWGEGEFLAGLPSHLGSSTGNQLCTLHLLKVAYKILLKMVTDPPPS